MPGSDKEKQDIRDRQTLPGYCRSFDSEVRTHVAGDNILDLDNSKIQDWRKYFGDWYAICSISVGCRR